MKRFFRSFRQLRWKLTLSYTLTSVVAFMLAVMLIFGGLLLFFGTHISTIVLNTLDQQAVQAVPYFAKAATNADPLAAWLQITSDNDASQNANNDPFHYSPLFLAATDTRGRVLASAGSQPLPVGTPLQTVLNSQNAAQLGTTLSAANGEAGAVGPEGEHTLVVIAPIPGAHGHAQGALVMKIAQPNAQVLFSWFFAVVLLTTVAATILIALTGTLFGSLIARSLTRRLKGLSAAADKWSRGDFSALAVDTSQDELGQMVQQFNRMAGQLQNLIETRQQLATLEERNRLARDLHDSIKQQVFAISMQIASTRILLKRDIVAAEERLQKTEKLVQQAQQELTTLIRELRPVALEGKGLVPALRELIPQWAQQTEIVANLRVEGAQALPQIVEEALFRVAQEALSNIARHSKANLVQITLSISGETVALAIQDDGQGFDPAHLEHRGVGLHSMQERMKALGGDLKLESSPGQGTLIAAHCPRLGVDKSEIMGTQASDGREGAGREGRRYMHEIEPLL